MDSIDIDISIEGIAPIMEEMITTLVPQQLHMWVGVVLKIKGLISTIRPNELFVSADLGHNYFCCILHACKDGFLVWDASIKC